MNKKKIKLTCLKFCVKRIATAGFFVMLIQISIAQDSISVDQIDEVIISASRTEQDPSDVGRSVSIITSEEISNSVHSNVAELLSEQEGVFIIGTRQTPGSLQSIYLRGTGTNQTVLLIDGVRITDPSSVDNSVNLAEISLLNIERIEIVRGAHSTLYGSSAIGGIVNIITKKEGDKGIHAIAKLTAGSFGKQTSVFSENLHLNYTSRYGFYLGGEIYNTNVKGLDATTDTITDPSIYNLNDNDNFNKTDWIAKIGYRQKNLDIFASYKSVNQTNDIDDMAFTDDDNNTLNFNRNLINYRASYNAFKNFRIKFSGGYTDMKRVAVDDSSIIDNIGTYDHAYSKDSYFGTVFNNELQVNYNLEGLLLLFGAGNYQETMSSNSYYTNTAWAYTSENSLDSLNIQSSLNTLFLYMNVNGNLISDKLNFIRLALGGRLNDHSSYGSNYTFDINPSFSINKNSLIYVSLSGGFNAPSLYRLYAPPSNYISGVTRGNQNLEPESSISYEFGIKQTVSKFEFNLSIFKTEIDNLIEYVYLWDRAIAIDTLGNDWLRDDYRGDTYINIGKQVNKGFELGIRSKLSEKFMVSGNISLISGSLTYNPEQNAISNDYHVQLFNTGDFLNKKIELQGLTRRSNTANIFINYKPVERLHLSADAKYVGIGKDIYYNSESGPYGALGQTGLKDYTLFGFTAGYQLKNNIQFTLRLDNVFNTVYHEIIGYNTKGRGIYLKITYSI